jgi:hypothetical protein
MEDVSKVAAKLPQMHEAALQLMERRRPSPIATYLSILSDAQRFDLTSDSALATRTKFNGYYGVRRNAAWRQAFYERFEEMKSDRRPPTVLFKNLLQEMFGVTGRVEASFASKALATLRPSSPVIDKILRDRLTELVRTPPFGGGIVEAVAYFRWLTEFMDGLSQTPEAEAWSKAFDHTFRSVPGSSGIHLNKKLDFLIWAARDVALVGDD